MQTARGGSDFRGQGVAGGVAKVTAEPAPPPPTPGAVQFSEAPVTAKAAAGDRPQSNRTTQIGRDGTIPRSLIIRTGSASIEVDSLEPAIARVRQLAQRVGGYVANTSIQAGREQARTATLELKLPAARFDQAISGLTPVGKVEWVNVTAQDVGEEFVDITARMANAQRLEERLITLLATRTGKLQDVLSVERELARVREEIERAEGRLRYLRSHVALSTLSVTVHEPVPVVGAYRGASVIGEAFRRAWRNLVSVIAALIASLGIVIPVAGLLVAAWLAVRHLRHRLRSPAHGVET